MREPGSYREALGLANGARERAFARAGRVRFDVAAARALAGQRAWYSRWYRRPRGLEPFADAVARGLRDDAVYLAAVDDMVAYLDAALRYARHRGQHIDQALRWLLRQLVVVLRPLMGEENAVTRVAELVVGRGVAPPGLPPQHRQAPQRRGGNR